jgi:hypothetical protein
MSINYYRFYSFFPKILSFVSMTQRKPSSFLEGFRGIVRIRTGVGAFAEPSLAARPRRHYLTDCKYRNYFEF